MTWKKFSGEVIHSSILEEVEQLLNRYVSEKKDNETFGDFAFRVILN